eukprot:8224988-Pyramimonas_sp.AAC.1
MEQAVYFGGLVNVHCVVQPEVARRLGEAKATFKYLVLCWSRGNICRRRKMDFTALSCCRG